MDADEGDGGSDDGHKNPCARRPADRASAQYRRNRGPSRRWKRVAARYAVAITPAVADLIDPADPDDPIARQFVPDMRELERPDESADPIGDDAHSPVEGIVHRYPDRVLLKLVNACAVYCRFCFRREMVGPGQGGLSRAALEAALDYIRATPQIWEVILTGGDPLVLSARRLKDVVDAAGRHRACQSDPRSYARAGRVRRNGSRGAMVRALAYDKATYVVLHANHPRELARKRAPPARV